MTEKVKFVRLLNATIHVTNESDTMSEYAISADMTISNGKVENFNVGNVVKDGNNLAHFTAWGENNMQVTYNTADNDENVKIYHAIADFISNSRKKAEDMETFNLS